MNAAQLFRSNLALIARAIGRVCRKARLSGPDAEDFASAVRLHLIEHDYAALRAFEGRCSLETYVTIVAQRFLANERIRAWGRWQESAVARRMGELAVMLERMVCRDGRTIDEALPLLRDLDSGFTRAQAEAILAELPERHLRPRAVDAPDVIAGLVDQGGGAEERVIEHEVRGHSERANHSMREALVALPLEDRMLVRFRFESGLAVSEIARILQVEQRPLYRKLERVLGKLREALTAAGVDRRAAADLVGSKLTEMDFGLRDAETSAPLLSMDHEAIRDQEGP